jgi:hypothetical protein
MHAFVLFLINLLKTEAVQSLIVNSARVLAQRTDNTIDDAAVEIVKDVIQVVPTVYK